MSHSKNKIALLCHDTGGSLLLSSWAMANSSNQFLILVKGPGFSIFNKTFPNESLLVTKEDEIYGYLKNFSPDWVLTGSGWSTEFEILGIQAALELKIPCTTFLDHWVNYQDRFLYQGKYYFPNEIWIGDQQAFEIAKKTIKDSEGNFPKNLKIQLVGNPYINQLTHKYRKLKTQEDPSIANILLLTEPTAEFAQKKTGDPYGFGFHEIDLVEHFFSQPNPLALSDEITQKIILRPHPAEKPQKYAALIASVNKVGSEKKFIVEISQNFDLVDDLLQATHVVGFESSALAMGHLLKIPSFSLIPKSLRKIKLPFDEIIQINE